MRKLTMKRNLTKAISAGALTASLAILPLTVSAQAQTNTTDPGVNTAPTTTTTYREDNNFDWGWLGLLGLLGLAGLAGKNRREEPTRYRDPNSTVGTSTYRE
jgi:LPXTG-motif cell wall-anchored protein